MKLELGEMKVVEVHSYYVGPDYDSRSSVRKRWTDVMKMKMMKWTMNAQRR